MIVKYQWQSSLNQTCYKVLVEIILTLSSSWTTFHALSLYLPFSHLPFIFMSFVFCRLLSVIGFLSPTSLCESCFVCIIFHILSFGDCFGVIFLYYDILLIMLITYFSTVFFILSHQYPYLQVILYIFFHILFLFFLNLASPTSLCASYFYIIFYTLFSFSF